jgi:hypothetical protein
MMDSLVPHSGSLSDDNPRSHQPLARHLASALREAFSGHKQFFTNKEEGLYGMTLPGLKAGDALVFYFLPGSCVKTFMPIRIMTQYAEIVQALIQSRLGVMAGAPEGNRRDCNTMEKQRGGR